MKYIAFLRGINVGGKNKISMASLRITFDALGFKEVKTYINSGNIIFSSHINDVRQLEMMCEAGIVQNFKLKIPVVIVTPDQLSAAMENAPTWWNIDKNSVNYAIFMIHPITITQVMGSVGEIKPEYEKLSCFENIIFWTAPLETFQKSRWSKIASSSVNDKVTIRTANTVKKMIDLAKS